MGNSNKFTVVNSLDGVTCGTYLTVYLESTTKGGTIVRREKAGVVPRKFKGVYYVVGKESDRCSSGGCNGCSCGCSGLISVCFELYFGYVTQLVVVSILKAFGVVCLLCEKKVK